jgi:hypothetical protein
LAEVRRPDARSRYIDRPDGKTCSFQIIEYKVEPSEAVLALNLFSNNDVRAALLDEVMGRRP